MRLVVTIFLISILPLFAEETKYTRSFHSPPHLVQVLESKYEGETLKELLSNAGANLSDEDVVTGPNGAGVIVRSTLNNLNTIEEIIKSCMPLQSAFRDSKDIKKTLINNKWDFTNLGIGIVSFKTKNSAIVTTRIAIDSPSFEAIDPLLSDPTENNTIIYNETTLYRWVLTKQNLLEFRSDKGKMLFTAVLFEDQLHIQDFHSKPSIQITVNSVTQLDQNKKENK